MSEGDIAQRVTLVDSALPTGVVTFLFSDSEGSMQMLEKHRAAAGTALARHHELLQQAVENASGVVLETVGDAVYGAFARPVHAVRDAAGNWRDEHP